MSLLQTEAPSGPLRGTRIIDLTMATAGPLATMLLADLGADVIKIENADRPESLQMMRVSLNRNKRSVALDLKSAPGQRAARDLIATAQVVVSSFRPGVMERMGLGADDLLPDRPDLVYAALSGYGEVGPSAHRRSMDKIVQADSGMMAAGGMVDHIALVDMMAGSNLAVAILGAVLERERTGRGGRISARLFDAALLLQAPDIAGFSLLGAASRDTAVAGYPAADQFPTRDGPVFIGAYYDWHWRALCRVLGLDELAEDPRFLTRELRTEPQHAALIRSALREATERRTRSELITALEDAGVMVTMVRDYAEVLADPQVALNQSLVEVPYGDTAVTLVRPPFDYDGQPVPVRRSSPDVGEDTHEVLGEIGYSPEQIELLKAGVPATTT
jgi:crotonobetainyl-CoA:carnitine CoA-transferase CaiB-like acyl-CoA transferase